MVYIYKKYFEDSDRKAFLVKVANELAGFVLLNKHCIIESVDWNMGEFFILAQFQNTGLAASVAREILHKFPGKWSVGAIPENIRAVKFWHKIITEISGGNYREIPKTGDELKTEDHPDPYPMIMMLFDTNNPKVQQEIKIRLAIKNDIPSMVALSYFKRRDYEKAQPQFWRYAENAEETQKKCFEELLAHEDHILLVAAANEQIVGFIIGRVINAPEVYNPGGLTLMIDDFCVNNPINWTLIGDSLVTEIKQLAKAKGATQILVVCGAHDEPKK